MKGAVASGHPLTSEAACEILRRGGTAFDAVVAAGFASVVVEPMLSGLGGGGFLLTHNQGADHDTLLDFFVNTPGLGCKDISPPPLIPVDLRFKSTVQRFHIGIGSVAVPGALKGLVHCYETLCEMDIEDIMKPALRYLAEGVEVTNTTAYLLDILRPINTHTDYGREILDLKEGDKIYNPLLREFLSDGPPERWIQQFYYGGDLPFERAGGQGACLLTPKDFRNYRVIERNPLGIPYRHYEILTNPPPSFGGTLLKLSLSLLDDFELEDMNEEDRMDLLASLMTELNEMRREGPRRVKTRFPFDNDRIRSAEIEIEGIFRGDSALSTEGTTHISIIDGEGNAASMTVSNGSNSGCFFGETGIMLNNMMGEDDLHPNGFYSLPPGRRISSMMSPLFIKSNGGIHAVMGSGGSKRIRTALLQTVINLIDKKMDVGDAVESPRVHLDDDDILQVEPGYDTSVVEYLKKYYKVNLWRHKDMYFGGVHTVMRDLSGRGDSRRGGSFMRV